MCCCVMTCAQVRCRVFCLNVCRCSIRVKRRIRRHVTIRIITDTRYCRVSNRCLHLQHCVVTTLLSLSSSVAIRYRWVRDYVECILYTKFVRAAEHMAHMMQISIDDLGMCACTLIIMLC